MSVNDAKDSSEVNRGESNISVASNIDANFAMQQQNNATISAPENTSMIEHKTTSISDITDPTKRREMDRETRRNARKTRRESRRAERKERHRLRKLTGVLFGGKKKIVWLVCIVIVLCGILGYNIFSPHIQAIREDAAFKEYEDKYKKIVDEKYEEMSSHIFDYEYMDELPEIKKQIDDIDEKDLRVMMLIAYASIVGSVYGRYDDAIIVLQTAESEAEYDYQKEELYYQTITICMKNGNRGCADEYLSKMERMNNRYFNYEVTL